MFDIVADNAVLRYLGAEVIRSSSFQCCVLLMLFVCAEVDRWHRKQDLEWSILGSLGDISIMLGR
jgi:hypothetical protein